MPYNEGYHGTDEATARRLLVEGFQPVTPDGWSREVYLAAPFQTYLAHTHGEKNAERTDSPNFGILRVLIPESHLQCNILGPDCLKFYGEEIDRIAIVGLTVYSRKGELIDGEPVVVTNEH